MIENGKVAKIKSAVRSNFDKSPSFYESFEQKHGFFRSLNRTLVSRMSLSAVADVLDIGCGTGASCRQIADYLPQGRVWGLDNSPAMLETARELSTGNSRIIYVEGDAGRLDEYFDFTFDAVIYSASIFLIPDYERSLRGAAKLLKPGGSLGLTFMDGVYDAQQRSLFELAERTAKQGVSLRKPVDQSKFEHFFAGMFPAYRFWNEDFQLSEAVLKEFFSVPAMSAGLFPGKDYPERVRSIASLFQHMPRCRFLFRWRLMVGELTGN